MRKVLRAEIKAAPESRIAVVCGAWHAPALVPADFPPARPRPAAPHEPAAHQGRRGVDAVDGCAAQLPLRLRRRGRRPRVVPAPLRPPHRRRCGSPRPRHDLAGAGGPHPARGEARCLHRVRRRGRPPRRDPRHRARAPVGGPRASSTTPPRPCCARARGSPSTWCTSDSWWAPTSAPSPSRRPSCRWPRTSPVSSGPCGSGRPRPSRRSTSTSAATASSPGRCCSTASGCSASGGASSPTPAAPPAPSRRAGRSSGDPSWRSTSSRRASGAPRSPPPRPRVRPTARRGPRTSPSWRPWSTRASPPTCPTASPPCSRRSTRGPRSSTTYPPCCRRSSRWPAPAATATCAASTWDVSAPCSAPPSSARASACRWRARAWTTRRRSRWSRPSPGRTGGSPCSPTPSSTRRGPGRWSPSPHPTTWRAPSPGGPPGSCSTPAGSTSTPPPTGWAAGSRSSPRLPRRRPGSPASSPGTPSCWSTTTTCSAWSTTWVGRARRDDVRGPAAAGAPYLRAVQPRRAPHHRRTAVPPRRARRAPVHRVGARPRPGDARTAGRGRLRRLEGGGPWRSSLTPRSARTSRATGSPAGAWCSAATRPTA